MALAECGRFLQRGLGSTEVFLAVEQRYAERIVEGAAVKRFDNL
jgi:hypothetical protein